MKNKRLTVFFYKDASGEWRWNLKSANGKIIADSGEGYSQLRGAEDGFALVQDLAQTAKQVKMQGKKKIVLWDPDAIDPDSSP